MGGALSSDGNSSKEKGDLSFRSGSFLEAIYWYTKEICECAHLFTENTENVGVDSNFLHLAVLYSNRSAAFLRNLQPQAAYLDALNSIRLNPTWPKGYFRAASACCSANKYFEAEQHLKMCQLLTNAKDPAITSLYEQIKQRIEACGKDAEEDTSQNLHFLEGNTSAYSWGLATSGQLGLGFPLVDQSKPTAITGLSGKHVIDISCGSMHTVAISEMGEAFSWGSNEHFQLGLGTYFDQNQTPIPTCIPKLLGMKIVAVSCGAGHTIVLNATGRVYSWGMGKQGQLGLGERINDSCEPQLISALLTENVVAVSCGIAHTFFLSCEGRICSCGMNNYGQLGLGNMCNFVALNGICIANPLFVHTPCLVSFNNNMNKVTHISCGGAHTLLVDSSGDLFSCGSNSCGQLGTGNNIDSHIFQKVQHFERGNVVFCACGEEFSAAITSTQSVFVWGLGIAGQIGNGQLTNQENPVLVSGVEKEGVETLCCGHSQILAVTSCGHVWSWGLPSDKAHLAGTFLGIQECFLTPSKVGSFGVRKKVRQIACGRKHHTMIIISPCGSLSFVKSGLCVHPDIYEAVAGCKFTFVVQAVDETGKQCVVGGCIFTVKVIPEFLDYEIRLRSQNISSFSRERSLDQNAEDNFDGTYTGEFRQYLAGLYHVKVMLGEMDIQNSPFEVEVKPNQIYQPLCDTWWGKFQLPQKAPIQEQKEEPKVEITCKTGDAVGFTVTTRDKYGNKCTNTEGYYVLVCVHNRNAGGLMCEGLNKQGFENSKVNDSNVQNPIFEMKWTEACLGIFPCSFRAPSIPGYYLVSVEIFQSFENVQHSVINQSTHVQFSPFHLTIDLESTNCAAACQFVGAKVGDEETQKNAMIQVKHEENVSEQEKLTCFVTKEAATQLRAELALKRRQAEIKAEKEKKRLAKAVKRIGGGFAIQYSKEI